VSRYPLFDRSRLRLKPLADRQHDMNLADLLPLKRPERPLEHPDLPVIAERILRARRNGRPVILSMGAHVIKQGCSRFVIDLLQQGLLTHIVVNGACVIHDFELALIGATTESVARYIREGQFGLWAETGRINDIAREAAQHGEGFGEAVGRTILQGDFPHKDVSICAEAYRLGVPLTVHVGIGYDIIHEHPNCDGAALGKASYTDFLIFARAVEELEGGVFLCFGSAVMGPEVYLKALAMARNVAHQAGRQIRHFTTAVFDLLRINADYHREPPKTDPAYYYRPWKTILVRTVADGGESFYIMADHKQSLPTLWHLLVSGLEATP